MTQKFITLQCDYCHELFPRRYSYHKYIIKHRKTETAFCSVQCRARYFTFDIPDNIVDRYEKGETIQQIANSLGYDYGVMWKALHRKNTKMRDNTWHMNTNRNPTKGKGHAGATKEKIRLTSIEQFSQPDARNLARHNQIKYLAREKSKTMSKLENIVAQALTNLEIKYKSQVPLRDPRNGQFFACADFRLDNGTVLEVHGGYWHADPRMYPDGPLYESQIVNIRNDQRRQEQMLELGIPLCIVWEIDIHKNSENAVLQALKSVISK